VDPDVGHGDGGGGAGAGEQHCDGGEEDCEEAFGHAATLSAMGRRVSSESVSGASHKVGHMNSLALVDPNAHDRFILRQRIRLVINQYEFSLPQDGDEPGHPLLHR
jgi:hypothetical protein